MEIRTATIEDYHALCEYNKFAYPDKVNVDIDKYIDFWFSKGDDEPSKTLIVINDDGRIVGQVFSSSMSFFYDGKKSDTVWGFDLMIDKDYRKLTWGVDLMLAERKLHKCAFSTGSNDNALALNKKLGCSDLGRIRKYVGLVSPLNLLASVFRQSVELSEYPSSVSSNGVIFRKIDYTDFPSIDSPFNNGLLEISRERAFLQWRYHNNLHEYAFYKADGLSDYFVVRTIVKRHITAMVLVDYRCNMENEEGVASILNAAKKIVRKLHLCVLIVGSSLATCDKVLEKSGFKSIGRPRPIIGWIKVKERQSDIDSRNFIFVTLADSDGETMW